MQVNKSDLNVRVFRTFDELLFIRETWVRLQSRPHTHYDFFQFIVNNRESIKAPYVLALQEGENIKAILIGRVEEAKLEYKVGYHTILGLTVRSITIPSGALLGTDNPDYCDLFLDVLRHALRNKEADVLKFGLMPQDSSLLGRVCANFSAIRRTPKISYSSHFRIDLPDEYDKFLAQMSAKHRRALNRYRRLLQNDNDGEISIRQFTHPRDVQQLCEDVESVASKTYQRGLGKGFHFSPEWAGRLNLAAQNGTLRGFVMYVRGVPSAFRLALVSGQVAYAEGTGYDQKFSEYRIGTLLLLDVVESLCEAGIRAYDLGPGHADYKERFSTHSWEEGSLIVHKPTVLGVLRNLSIAFLIWLNESSSSLTRKFGYLDFIKTRWRRARAQR